MDVRAYIDAAEHYVPSLEGLGFNVGIAFEAVLWVEGYGWGSYISLDETDALDCLIDPELHAERVESFENPPAPPVNEEPSLEERIAELEQKIEGMPPQHRQEAGSNPSQGRKVS